MTWSGSKSSPSTKACVGLAMLNNASRNRDRASAPVTLKCFEARDLAGLADSSLWRKYICISFRELFRTPQMFGNLATSQRPMVLRARLATGLPLSHRRSTLRAYSICIDSRKKIHWRSLLQDKSCPRFMSAVHYICTRRKRRGPGNVVFRGPLRLYAVLFTKITFGGFAFSSIMRYRWPTSMKGAQ